MFNEKSKLMINLPNENHWLIESYLKRKIANEPILSYQYIIKYPQGTIRRKMIDSFPEKLFTISNYYKIILEHTKKQRREKKVKTFDILKKLQIWKGVSYAIIYFDVNLEEIKKIKDKIKLICSFDKLIDGNEAFSIYSLSEKNYKLWTLTNKEFIEEAEKGHYLNPEEKVSSLISQSILESSIPSNRKINLRPSN